MPVPVTLSPTNSPAVLPMPVIDADPAVSVPSMVEAAVPPPPLVAFSARSFDVMVAEDELWLMLAAVFVVVPTGLTIFPARMTGAFGALISTEDWAAPLKLMPIGLSALTNWVRVSVAEVGKS